MKLKKNSPNKPYVTITYNVCSKSKSNFRALRRLHPHSRLNYEHGIDTGGGEAVALGRIEESLGLVGGGKVNERAHYLDVTSVVGSQPHGDHLPCLYHSVPLAISEIHVGEIFPKSTEN